MSRLQMVVATEHLSWAERHLAALASPRCPLDPADRWLEVNRVATIIAALRDDIVIELDAERPRTRRELEDAGAIAPPKFFRQEFAA